MTIRTRRATTPAYYLGRPAALWLTALTPKSAPDRSPRASCAREVDGSSPAGALDRVAA
jgi:hypothetical protein